MNEMTSKERVETALRFEKADRVPFNFWMDRYFEVYEPGSFIYPKGSYALGFGPGASLGAKIGAGEKPVALFGGDGGFLYAAAELATAARYRLALRITLRLAVPRRRLSRRHRRAGR